MDRGIVDARNQLTALYNFPRNPLNPSHESKRYCTVCLIDSKYSNSRLSAKGKEKCGR